MTCDFKNAPVKSLKMRDFFVEILQFLRLLCENQSPSLVATIMSRLISELIGLLNRGSIGDFYLTAEKGVPIRKSNLIKTMSLRA